MKQKLEEQDAAAAKDNDGTIQALEEAMSSLATEESSLEGLAAMAKQVAEELQVMTPRAML